MPRSARDEIEAVAVLVERAIEKARRQKVPPAQIAAGVLLGIERGAVGPAVAEHETASRILPRVTGVVAEALGLIGEIRAARAGKRSDRHT